MQCFLRQVVLQREGVLLAGFYGRRRRSQDKFRDKTPAYKGRPHSVVLQQACHVTSRLQGGLAAQKDRPCTRHDGIFPSSRCKYSRRIYGLAIALAHFHPSGHEGAIVTCRRCAGGRLTILSSGQAGSGQWLPAFRSIASWFQTLHEASENPGDRLGYGRCRSLCHDP